MARASRKVEQTVYGCDWPGCRSRQESDELPTGWLELVAPAGVAVPAEAVLLCRRHADRREPLEVAFAALAIREGQR